MSVDTLSPAREPREADLSGTQAEAIAAVTGRIEANLPDAGADLKLIAVQLQAGLQVLDHRLGALKRRLNARIEASRSSLLIRFVGVLIAPGGLGLAVAKL